MNRMNQIAVASLTCIAAMAADVSAQAPAAPSLQDLLKTQYKVTKAGNDDQGFKILDPGTVVIAKQAGIMATAQPKPHVPVFKLFKICDNTFKNGNLTVPKGCAGTTIGSHYLTVGEKLYITKFEVNEKSNKITFNLVECDSCNGVTAQSSMKASIIFEFANKFLDSAEPGQVTDVINQVFQVFTPVKGRH